MPIAVYTTQRGYEQALQSLMSAGDLGIVSTWVHVS